MEFGREEVEWKGRRRAGRALRIGESPVREEKGERIEMEVESRRIGGMDGRGARERTKRKKRGQPIVRVPELVSVQLSGPPDSSQRDQSQLGLLSLLLSTTSDSE